MGRNRFVSPDIVRIDLSDGDFINIKRELNTGEQRRVFSRFVKEARSGERFVLDPEQVGLTKIVEYLIGWSFVDASGAPVDVSEEAIKSLDVDTFKEIKEAIDQHEAKVDAERSARKNGTAGTPPSAVISASAA
jgi:hypothetical protein